MTDFIFARLVLRYTKFSIPTESGKRSINSGFNSYKTDDKVLQRGENYTLSAEFNGLYTSIPLKNSNPIQGFFLASYKILLCFTFRVARFTFRVARSVFHVQRSTFRVQRLNDNW